MKKLIVKYWMVKVCVKRGGKSECIESTQESVWADLGSPCIVRGMLEMAYANGVVIALIIDMINDTEG